MTEPLHTTEPLHDDLVAIAGWADPVTAPDPELLEAHEVRSEPPRDEVPWRRLLAAAAAVLVVLAGVWVLTGRDQSDPVEPTPGEAAWVETAPSPLQARNEAQAVWTGSEFVVFAGTQLPDCPVCDYLEYGDTLHDAAAYDPKSDSWRMIAPLPDEASYVGQAAVANGDVYWFSVRDPSTNANGIDATLYRYQPLVDTWTKVPLPDAVPNAPKLTSTGDAILLYPSTDEAGDFSDWIWRAADVTTWPTLVAETWTALPEDPFPNSNDRQYVQAGDRLLLFNRSLLSGQTGVAPVVQGASLFAGEWKVMPSSDQMVPPTVVDFGDVYAPIGGGIDAASNSFGRDIPYGGVYDTDADAWRALPAPVPDDLVGMVGRGGSQFLGGIRGSILDVGTGAYRSIPSLPDGLSDGYAQALASGGVWFFSFGGTTGGVTATDGTSNPSPLGVHSRAFRLLTNQFVVASGNDQTSLDQALGELGIDKDGAPNGALDLAGGKFCGYEEVTFGDSGMSPGGRACFANALEADTAAIFITQMTTTEGDPIAYVFVTNGGTDRFYVDATRDAFGSGEWEQRECPLTPVAGSPAFLCTDDAPTPTTDPPVTDPPASSTSTLSTGTGQATAVWTFDPNRPPAPGDTQLVLMVSRLGCSGGVTGEVLSVNTSETDDQVVATAWVAALPPGDYTCPGNDSVPFVITLSKPLGGRSVVDGACLAGEASRTSFCENGGIRLGVAPTGDTNGGTGTTDEPPPTT